MPPPAGTAACSAATGSRYTFPLFRDLYFGQVYPPPLKQWNSIFTAHAPLCLYFTLSPSLCVWVLLFLRFMSHFPPYLFVFFVFFLLNGTAKYLLQKWGGGVGGGIFQNIHQCHAGVCFRTIKILFTGQIWKEATKSTLNNHTKVESRIQFNLYSRFTVTGQLEKLKKKKHRNLLKSLNPTVLYFCLQNCHDEWILLVPEFKPKLLTVLNVPILSVPRPRFLTM